PSRGCGGEGRAPLCGRCSYRAAPRCGPRRRRACAASRVRGCGRRSPLPARRARSHRGARRPRRRRRARLSRARPPRPSEGACRWGTASPRALCWQPVNLAAYRADAEEFVSSLDREYYLHFAGLQDEFDIEAIYERHAELFSRDNVQRLLEEGTRQLVDFAVHGLNGCDTKAEQAELARREAALEIEVDGERMPYRQAAVVQVNEPDPDRRAAIEDARLEAAAAELDPLLREVLERSHALTAELGWPSMRAMCEDLSGIDRRAPSARRCGSRTRCTS